jgi:hypothetical protein
MTIEGPRASQWTSRRPLSPAGGPLCRFFGSACASYISTDIASSRLRFFGSACASYISTGIAGSRLCFFFGSTCASYISTGIASGPLWLLTVASLGGGRCQRACWVCDCRLECGWPSTSFSFPPLHNPADSTQSCSPLQNPAALYTIRRPSTQSRGPLHFCLFLPNLMNVRLQFRE